MRTPDSRSFTSIISAGLLKATLPAAHAAEPPDGKMDVSGIPEHVRGVASAIRDAGGRAMLVGGAVRDMATGRKPKDFDLEVHNLHPDRLHQTLSGFGEVNAVGKSFGVLKLNVGGHEMDVSVPRRDSKTGAGHKGFIATPDPSMGVREAARRRDFTMNAIAVDPLTGDLHDPFGGRRDIRDGVIRHVDPSAFAEDPLRVLRAAQFAGRFGMRIHPETVALARSVRHTLRELPKERVGGEWEKLLMKSERPSAGLDALHEMGVLEAIHPEIHALHGAEQDPSWHPEGHVLRHTGMVLDEAAALTRNMPEKERRAVMYAALLHDIAKPATIGRQPDGSITHHGHEPAGEPVAKRIMAEQMGVDLDTAAVAARLVGEHLKPKELYGARHEVGDSAVRRLARRLAPASLEQLVALGRADSLGRGSEKARQRLTPEEDWLAERAGSLGVHREPPKPILMGRHLLEMGVRPGKEMGRILDRVFEMQMDGRVADLDGAVAAARSIVAQGSAG